MIDLKAIRAAANAATPGPWVHGSDGRKELNNVSHFIEDCVPKWNRSLKEHLPALIVYGVNRAEDASHIATANPSTVLALCDEIERLRKENDFLNLHRSGLIPLMEEMNSMSQDAARYRLLRRYPLSVGHGSLQVFMDDRCGSGNYHKMVWDKELDAAIDKQLEERKT